MEFIKVENDIWKLADGSLYEGDVSGISGGQASKIAKKGHEYQKDYLEKHGWGVKKEAPKKKSVKKSEVEDKAIKPSDVEDK